MGGILPGRNPHKDWVPWLAKLLSSGPSAAALSPVFRCKVLRGPLGSLGTVPLSGELPGWTVQSLELLWKMMLGI